MGLTTAHVPNPNWVNAKFEKEWGAYFLGAGFHRQTLQQLFRSLQNKIVMVAAILAIFIASEWCSRLSLCFISL